MSRRRDELRVKVYQREGRWYGDFRHLGGGRLALIPPGETRGAMDELVAHSLYVAQARELLEERGARRLGIARRLTLAELGRRFIDDLQAQHLARGTPRLSSLRCTASRLTRVVETLGGSTQIAAIDAKAIESYALQRESDGYARNTVRGDTSSLAQLLRWAVRHGYLRTNPAREAMLPPVNRAERPFLEPVLVGYLLRAAEEIDADAAAYIALAAIAGLRSGEILGLDALDIDRDRAIVRVRPNAWRELKTPQSSRDVPVWPQLRPYLPARITGALLPGHGRRRHTAKPLLNPYAFFARAIARARELAAADGVAFPATHITPHTLRHTYCAMRLQTLDAGEPVALYTVMRETGWSELKMVERVYGHLPKDRRRLDRVEYPMPVSAAAAVRRA